MLGQAPESVGVSQAPTLGVVRNAVEVLGRGPLWQLEQGINLHHAAAEPGEEQLSSPVRKGGDPLADGGADRARTLQMLHQSIDAQTKVEIPGYKALQEGNRVVPEGMQKVGEQTVGAPTGLTADALHADAIDLQAC